MTARDRLAAWIVTGPLGHLWSVLADVAVLLARYAWGRVAARARHERAAQRSEAAAGRRSSRRL